MPGWTASMEMLIEAFKKLPGVGNRTAERYVFHLLSQPAADAETLAKAIVHVKRSIGFCELCFNLADDTLCSICQDPQRDRTLLCVVEDHRSIRAFEKGGSFKGLYHVLLGALSPLDGVGPKDLKIQALKARLEEAPIEEIILATDSDLEGESTALYLSKHIKQWLPEGREVRISRLAFGIPMGSTVEFADQMTLSRALEGRQMV